MKRVLKRLDAIPFIFALDNSLTRRYNGMQLSKRNLKKPVDKGAIHQKHRFYFFPRSILFKFVCNRIAMHDESSGKLVYAVLDLRNIAKVFGPRSKDTIKLLENGLTKAEAEKATHTTVGVFDASFHIETGETFVIMGLSGSGKSTLLRCINRIHEPDKGQVIVDDVDVTALNWGELQDFRRKKFGMVFQSFALFPHRTVIANVAYGLEIRGVPHIERMKRAEEMLEQVGLAGWGNHRPNELSGGMQQRVGIARALAIDPDILLMDEAFSALDPLIRREMQNELLTLQAQMKKTIVFVTHDLDEALKIGDRIAVMKDGRIVQIGTPEQIITDPATEYVAAFTAGVDRSKVLTAGAVMKPIDPVIRPKDGPRTALDRMRRHGISSIFMVHPDGKLIGLLHAKDAREAANNGQSSVVDLVDETVPSIDMDTPLKETMMTSVDESWPIAVVDSGLVLKGVLVKGAILSALSDDNHESNDQPALKEDAHYASV